jgi:uncharacterized protein (TIGR02145 family)
MVLTTCKKSKEAPPSSGQTAVTYWPILVGQTWATLEGMVNANNQSTTVSFEYDTTTAYKNNISATPDTMSGNTNISVSAYLTGLIKSTKYYYRVKIESSVGTTYGSNISFTTKDSSGIVIIFNPNLTYDSISDYDGNTYKTIQIGTQTWMAENLRTLKYNDGTSIPFITDGVKWKALTTPGYCWYDNDSVAYGPLYNWYTVNTGKLCPTGWHVPSDAEWTLIETYLGGSVEAGGKMKEIGTTHWSSPNTGATNESGFTALPGGYCNYFGSFNSIRRHGYWWSSTEVTSENAYCRDIFYGYSNTDRSVSNQKGGFSVRCIKN